MGTKKRTDVYKCLFEVLIRCSTIGGLIQKSSEGLWFVWFWRLLMANVTQMHASTLAGDVETEVKCPERQSKAMRRKQRMCWKWHASVSGDEEIHLQVIMSFMVAFGIFCWWKRLQLWSADCGAPHGMTVPQLMDAVASTRTLTLQKLALGGNAAFSPKVWIAIWLWLNKTFFWSAASNTRFFPNSKCKWAKIWLLKHFTAINEKVQSFQERCFPLSICRLHFFATLSIKTQHQWSNEFKVIKHQI